MNLLDIVRWIVAIPLLLLSAFFIVTNVRFLFENIKLGVNAGPAPVTMVGGLAGSLGLLLLPVMGFTDRLALIWIPLFIDLGSAPFYLSMLAIAVWQGLNKAAWKKSPDFVDGGNT
jgi:hypothetical protein